MSNFDQVGKFENIAKNSEGSTKEKMDIYSDSVEASKNRRTAAIEEMTQEFNILGADGDDILIKWNNLITYLIKNAKTLLTIFAGILTVTKGIMAGGLAKTAKSLVISANNFGTKFERFHIGKNTKLYQKLNGIGVGSGAMNQIRDQYQQSTYNTAYQTAVKGGADAISADRSASFLSGMDAKQQKAFMSLSQEEQKKIISKYGKDDASTATTNKIVSTGEALISALDRNTAAINGDADVDTNNPNTTPINQTVAKNAQGKVVGTATAKPSTDNALSNGATPIGPQKFNPATDNLADNAKVWTDSVKQAGAIQIQTAA